MKRSWCICLVPLMAVSACAPAIPREKPPTVQVAAMVDSLYKEVVARHPFSIPDRKVFGPYLSKRLLHSFDLEDACFDRWRRANPDPNLKPEVGLIEFRVFSGGFADGSPQAFQIAKVETEKDGSYRAHVKLTYAEPSFKQTWYVEPVVIRENGRFVVDDVVYLKQDDVDETRLSEVIKEDCKGYEG